MYFKILFTEHAWIHNVRRLNLLSQCTTRSHLENVHHVELKGLKTEHLCSDTYQSFSLVGITNFR